MDKRLKLTAYIILSILIVFCLCADAFYLIVKYTMPTKVVVSTFNIGTLKNVEEESEKYVINARYYSNKDNSGVELFDVKINYYMNEDSVETEDPDVYSSGIQVVGNSQNSITSSANLYSTYTPIFGTWTYRFKIGYNQPMYYYNTHNGINFTATNKIDNNNFFRISIGDKIYGMQFIGKQNIEQFDKSPYKKSFLGFNTINNFIDYDINYFSGKLLESVRSLPSGTSAPITFEFEELFNFYEFSNGTYKLIDTSNKEGAIIKNKVINYFTIKVETFDTGAKVASDSLFNIIENKYNYQNSSEALTEYFIGDKVITLNEYAFEYYEIVSKNYSLKLKETIIKKLNSEDFKTYKINILIDETNLQENNNVVCYGFLENSGLKDFKDRINNIILKSTDINGEITTRTVNWNDTQFE